MSDTQFHLFGTRRFLPLFWTQFCGALNDNLFKNALVMLVLYRIAERAGMNETVLVTVAAGLFILPFFLFSALAGQLADKIERSALIRRIKLAEIGIMSLGVASLWLGHVPFMLVVLFLMGCQSAFFGPVKYAILPDHLREDELIGGNALVEAGTFLAILLGTVAGGLLILAEQGVALVSAGVLSLAVGGWACSLYIPKAAAPAPSLKLSWNVVRETRAIIKGATARRGVFLSILGISWFWLVGATLLTQIPAFTKQGLQADEAVVTLFLTVFSVGIALGSLLCNRLLKGEVTAKHVPFGILGMTVFLFDLAWTSSGASPLTVIDPGAEFAGLGAFFSTGANWRLIVDLLGISVCGGLFIVPLYAILQSQSEEETRSRTIAANNILNAGFMVLGAVAAAGLLMAGIGIPGLFLVLGAVNLGVAIYICTLLPDALIRTFFVLILKFFYRVELRGKEHLDGLGDKAVIVANHVSLIDGILIAAFLPGKLTFAVDTFAARGWLTRQFLRWVDAFPVDPTNPMAVKSLIQAVREGRRCVIFPEGRLTATGALMKVNEGPGMVADKADAPIIPIRIDGAQYTPFSRLKGKLRIRWFPKITITIQPPQRFEIPEGKTGRARRQFAATKLYDIMSNLIFDTRERPTSLYEALLDARSVHGGAHIVAEDPDRAPMSYDRLVLGAQILGRKIAGFTAPGERIGLLLPNSLGGVTGYFALQAYGRVPAMLNFSTGARNMVSAARTAALGTILTSRRFVEAADLTDAVAALAEIAEIRYLEDIRDGVTLTDKLIGLVSRPFARLLHARHRIDPDAPATVLFTSGSEGTPKGVVLSHNNFLANQNQLKARIDFNPTDTVFNALPIFHSFGLTGGTLLPILSGVKTFLYPSPLHYRIVPALVYDTNATILFGTDTFLSGYARVADAYDFYSVRYVFAGAEKVKEETRRCWADRFGLRILEGYGATETAPVLATNTPMHFKSGSVGRLMPGLSPELEQVPGIAEGGRLIVTGPNVMLGYLKAENPGVLEPVEGQRYDTGDIVTIDEDGFVTIQGRAKRFAKIAGEMVSLTAVEGYAGAVWPDALHATIAVPDPKKGEQVILFTDRPDADRAALLSYARENGIAEIMIPKEVRILDTLPILGTGKVDYVGIRDRI